LLKVLEEPPSSALFILATTDPHKILDTVKSRCFQLFFQSIPCDQLLPYLEDICKQENIVYNKEGLQIISEHCQGSARDALNLIERVRLAYSKITDTNIYSVLKIVDTKVLCLLFKAICSSDC